MTHRTTLHFHHTQTHYLIFLFRAHNIVEFTSNRIKHTGLMCCRRTIARHLGICEPHSSQTDTTRNTSGPGEGNDGNSITRHTELRRTIGRTLISSFPLHLHHPRQTPDAAELACRWVSKNKGTTNNDDDDGRCNVRVCAGMCPLLGVRACASVCVCVYALYAQHRTAAASKMSDVFLWFCGLFFNHTRFQSLSNAG